MQEVGSAWERSLRRVGVESFRFHKLSPRWCRVQGRLPPSSPQHPQMQLRCCEHAVPARATKAMNEMNPFVIGGALR